MANRTLREHRGFFLPFVYPSLLFLTMIPAGGCAGSRPRAPSGATVWEGTASWYGPGFHGRRTASGEVFDMYDYTAAHPFLPFGTRVRVTNLANHRSVVVRINDRGPHAKNRIIDLSYQAAKKIGMIGPGTAKVRVEVVAYPPRSRRSGKK